MLCFVTFLACVAMDDVVLDGLIMHNIHKYNFWFGRSFQLGPMSSFAEEATTVKAGVSLFEIRVFCALRFAWTQELRPIYHKLEFSKALFRPKMNPKNPN